MPARTLLGAIALLTLIGSGAQAARSSGRRATATSHAAAPQQTAAPKARAVRLIFGGDVMLGRGVAKLAATHPGAVFAGVRFQLGSANLTVANLESPLTMLHHVWSHGPDALEARRAIARVLAAAGFDAMAIANNHAGDAGPGTVPDTIRALAAAHLPAIGAGRDEAAAYTPRVLEAGGMKVAFLSFDDTGEGPRATATRPGVAWWNRARAHRAVNRARQEADLVVVGLHGGTDYNPTTDPWLLHLGRLLSSWGVDIVWGSGPHVVQPTRVISQPGGRSTIVATSLGNLLFDQHIQGTRDGELLEVLAGTSGVRAYRLGTTAQTASNAVEFSRWRAPTGDAAAIAGEWWTLAGSIAPARVVRPASLAGFPVEHVASAAIGDPVGNGSQQVAVSFWRRYRRTDVNALIPRARLVDRRGLTNHVGLYEPRDHREIWVAGTVLTPVTKLAACDGSLALATSALNGKAVVSTDVWQWHGFGFAPLPALPGPGIPACADVDGDGSLDPVILGRRS